MAMKPRIPAAAGLVCAVVVLATFTLFMGDNSHAQIAHTCSATDRQFIDAAELNMAALASIAEDYLHGDAKAGDVLETTQGAWTSIRSTGPTDSSLSKARAILSAMFVEYGKAIRAHSKNRDPGRYIYRAYGLANFAHDVLSQAEGPLKQRGCDVTPLL